MDTPEFIMFFLTGKYGEENDDFSIRLLNVHFQGGEV
jgi:hypothetical protein